MFSIIAIVSASVAAVALLRVASNATHKRVGGIHFFAVAGHSVTVSRRSRATVARKAAKEERNGYAPRAYVSPVAVMVSIDSEDDRQGYGFRAYR